MSDTDDISNIIDETPAPEDAVPDPVQPEPAPPEVEAEAPPEPKPQPQQEAPMVPQAVVGELRQELRQTRQELAMMRQGTQPQPQQPDYFENPEAAVQHHVQPIQQQLLQQKLDMSRFTAEQQFGPELVQQAYDYFDANPAASQALRGHASPFHAAVQEFQKVQIANEVGNDPAAYREKVRAEVAAELRKELVAKQTAAAVAQAPSMADETSIGGRGAPAPTLTSLDDILGG